MKILGLEKDIMRAILWFLIVHLVALVCYLGVFYCWSDRQLAKGIMAIFMIIVSLYYIQKEKLNAAKAKVSYPYLKVLAVIVLVFFLFIGNNWIQRYYLAMDFNYRWADLSTYLWIFVFSSTREELMYRGYLQVYIDARVDNTGYELFSKGILWSSLLMFLTHIGFFWVMPIESSLVSISLVGIFSLAMGWIMRKTNQLWLVVLIHILVNWTHLMINIQ